MVSQSTKSAGYESDVYMVSGAAIKVDVHSTFTPSTLLWCDVITIDEGEGDQPIKQKCWVRKLSVHGLGLFDINILIQLSILF